MGLVPAPVDCAQQYVPAAVPQGHGHPAVEDSPFQAAGFITVNIPQAINTPFGKGLGINKLVFQTAGIAGTCLHTRARINAQLKPFTVDIVA